MDIGNLISNLIILLAILFVYHWQKNKISALETTINSPGTILNSIKTYFDIFKLDEVKKYTELSVENVKLEYEKEIKLIRDGQQSEINTIKDITVPKEMYNEMIDNFKDYIGSSVELTAALFAATTKEKRKLIRGVLKLEKTVDTFDDYEKAFGNISLTPQMIELLTAENMKLNS